MTILRLRYNTGSVHVRFEIDMKLAVSMLRLIGMILKGIMVPIIIDNLYFVSGCCITL